MRIHQSFIGILCILFGGLTSVTSIAMVVGMLLTPETRAENLFWVGVVGSVIAPPIFLSGLRLLFNRPNQHGGIFAPNMLRLMAIFCGVIGGTIVILALQQGDYIGALRGATFLFFTQGAFVLANRRAKT